MQIFLIVIASNKWFTSSDSKQNILKTLNYITTFHSSFCHLFKISITQTYFAAISKLVCHPIQKSHKPIILCHFVYYSLPDWSFSFWHYCECIYTEDLCWQTFFLQEFHGGLPAGFVFRLLPFLYTDPNAVYIFLFSIYSIKLSCSRELLWVFWSFFMATIANCHNYFED